MVDSVYFVKSTLLRALIESFQNFEGMLQAYCMKKFEAEKYFFDKLTWFLS